MINDMEFESRSFIGSRAEQQDHYNVMQDQKGLFAVLCDGMGGRKNGSLAAQSAVDIFSAAYMRRNTDVDPKFLLTTAERADRYIATGIEDKSGCTVICAYIDDDRKLMWVSVGDSRLYVFRNGRLRQVTKDHNYFYLLNKKLENNEINEKEYKAAGMRGEALISFLGMNGFELADISIRPLALLQGDIVLLTSDGLYKLLGDANIERLLALHQGDLGVCADSVIGRVKASNEPSIDNTSFILIKI